MKLDYPKLYVELIMSRVINISDENVKRSLLQKAVDICKSRAGSGRAHYEATGDLKGLKVNWDATVELGNLLLELDNRDGSRIAQSDALALVEEIAQHEPSPAMDRSIAITIYNLASVSEPVEAIKLVRRAINLQRTVIEREPNYSRRNRDLAYMLALRGSVQIENNIDVAAGILDIEESAYLFTKRAINNPQEVVAQIDFEKKMTEFSQLLTDAGKPDLVNKICIGSIDLLEHVASGQSVAGRNDWTEILNRLRVQIEQTETAAVPQ
jgi:hypothetical protein